MLRNKLECNEWNYFVENFKQLSENVQELILKKLHGGSEVQCIQQRTLTIDASKLTKYRRWLPIIVCLLTLIPIKKIIATYQNISFFDRRNFTRLNIDVLIEKWMPCDLLWALRCPNSKYVSTLRGNEEYCCE